ncbi:MAG: ABC transporter ATP-binding protein [Thermoleophilia bacterium]|nr:ABC transporter ATP-binding protein [Thermoleophilia bacterium]
MSTTETVIQTDDLSKRFGAHRGIEDVSLEVGRGEVFGLLGPNGAGKSTAIRLLLGLIRPSAGSGSVLGMDCWRRRREIHRRVGVLPSDFAYEDELTGRQVIEFFGRLRGVPVSERAGELAERLRADLDRPQKHLSHGNHQKVGLIQALVHEPQLLLFDEPTGGLDPLMQEEFLKIVGELRDDGRTVLLSSHNMAEVERSCDRIAMIHEGRLLAVETVSSLLGRAPKHMRVVFDGPADGAIFSSLPGVDDVQTQGNAVELDVSGDINAVLHAATDRYIVDLVCERPSLEHAFVRLYEDDGDSVAAAPEGRA